MKGQQSQQSIKLLSKEDLPGFGDKMHDISIGLNQETCKNWIAMKAKMAYKAHKGQWLSEAL